MGKHERGWAKLAEQNVANVINGQSSNSYCEEIANAVIKHINTLYPSDPVMGAAWIGGADYENKGDIQILLQSGRTVPVELKCSKAGGTGTLSNSSTNVLKKFFGPSTKNYPTLDTELGLKSQRYKLVEDKTKRPIVKNSSYTTALRELRETDPDFLKIISDVTEPGKHQYAEYVADLMNRDLPAANKLTEKLLAGHHTVGPAVDTDDLVFCVVRHFESPKQSVDFYDLAAGNTAISKVTAVGSSIVLANSGGAFVLRMSVTWKNICQGGATPCFNIFLNAALF